MAKNEDTKNDSEKLKNQSNEYWMWASSQFSKQSRQIIWALLGSLWVMFFDHTKEHVTSNPGFCISFVLCLVYLFIDVIQYFHYTLEYHDYAIKFENNHLKNKPNAQKDIDRYNSIGNNSILFHHLKMIVATTTTIFFMYGLYKASFFDNLF